MNDVPASSSAACDTAASSPHDTPWLDDEEQLAWRSILEMSVRLLAGLDADLGSHGLDGADYEILVRLSESPDHRLRMSDLASQVLVSRSRLTYRIDHLERDGIVDRASCPTDKRGAFAVLTTKGSRFLDEVAPHHVRSVRAGLVDRLSRADLLRLGELAATVVAGEASA